MKTRFYEKPVMEVTSFESSDVITLSVVQASTKSLNLDDSSVKGISVKGLSGKWNS
jgi:hypothetical protein